MTRWETMLHECYVREWWLLDEAPALIALMDALLQHFIRLLAQFQNITEQTLAGIIVGHASAQQSLESGSLVFCTLPECAAGVSGARLATCAPAASAGTRCGGMGMGQPSQAGGHMHVPDRY